MLLLRRPAQCVALAFCALFASASIHAVRAQSGGSMSVSDSAHGKMKAPHDTGSMAKMGDKAKMGGMAKPKDAMGTMDAKKSKMGPPKMKSSKTHGDSAMMDDSKGMKKPKHAVAKDSTKKM